MHAIRWAKLARASCKYPLLVAVAAALAGFGGAPGSAAAQAPSYQPDSPAGTEYAIPLDEARKTGSASTGEGSRAGASGRPTSGSAAGGDAALFGEGVTPVRKSSKSSAGSSHKPARTKSAAGTSATADLRPTAAGVSGTAVALGTGGLVLALGAALAGAIVMSRRGVLRSR